jgi:hypothetical protein
MVAAMVTTGTAITVIMVVKIGIIIVVAIGTIVTENPGAK